MQLKLQLTIVSLLALQFCCAAEFDYGVFLASHIAPELAKSAQVWMKQGISFEGHWEYVRLTQADSRHTAELTYGTLLLTYPNNMDNGQQGEFINRTHREEKTRGSDSPLYFQLGAHPWNFTLQISLNGELFDLEGQLSDSYESYLELFMRVVHDEETSQFNVKKFYLSELRRVEFSIANPQSHNNDTIMAVMFLAQQYLTGVIYPKLEKVFIEPVEEMFWHLKYDAKRFDKAQKFLESQLITQMKSKKSLNPMRLTGHHVHRIKKSEPQNSTYAIYHGHVDKLVNVQLDGKVDILADTQKLRVRYAHEADRFGHVTNPANVTVQLDIESATKSDWNVQGAQITSYCNHLGFEFDLLLDSTNPRVESWKTTSSGTFDFDVDEKTVEGSAYNHVWSLSNQFPEFYSELESEILSRLRLAIIEIIDEAKL